MTVRAVAEVTSRVLDSLASFTAAPHEGLPTDSTLEAEDDRRRRALRSAVDRAVPDWSDEQREATAAALDVLWSLPSYERLLVQWKLGHERSASIIEWLIGLLVDAVERDSRPPDLRSRSRPGRRVRRGG
jgi:hypothetical protein